MADFCTRTDVLEVAQPIGQDVRENQIDDARIDDAIAEASEMVRIMIQPRYRESDFGGITPPAIRYLCRLKAGIILIERYQGASGASYDDLVKKMNTQINFWMREIARGTIYDTNGDIIPVRDAPSKVEQPSYLADFYNGNQRII